MVVLEEAVVRVRFTANNENSKHFHEKYWSYICYYMVLHLLF